MYYFCPDPSCGRHFNNEKALQNHEGFMGHAQFKNRDPADYRCGVCGELGDVLVLRRFTEDRTSTFGILIPVAAPLLKTILCNAHKVQFKRFLTDARILGSDTRLASE